MKLLKKVSPTIDEDGMVICMNQITKIMQTELIEKSVAATSLTGKMKMVDYVLTKCVKTLTLDGKAYDPVELSENADIGDDETFTALMAITEKVVAAAFLKDEDKKK